MVRRRNGHNLHRASANNDHIRHSKATISNSGHSGGMDFFGALKKEAWALFI